MGSFAITKNVSPTNVTAFTLGIVRADTSAVVVAPGTPLTNTAPGVYTLTFTSPAPGLTYTITYSLTLNGNTSTWPEDFVDTGEESIPYPPLTNNPLVDTYNSLMVERLRVARAGPRVSYNVHNHKYDWNQYMEILDKRILALRVQIAQSQPWEAIGEAW